MASLRPEEDWYDVIKLMEGNVKKPTKPNIWKVGGLHSTKKEESESTSLTLHPFDPHAVAPGGVPYASIFEDISPPRTGV